MRSSPGSAGTSLAERLARHGLTSGRLSALSDRQLRQRLEESPDLGSGIGGTSTLLQVDGTPVFVKRVPLTDLERHPSNVMSTANVFQLPTFYQYGVGSTGFGAWRELAALSMTTDWVVGKQCQCFPLLYHWRVLAGASAPGSTPEGRAELERMVAYWDGSATVRRRLEAIAGASASLVLCLEYFPHSLHEWLRSQPIDTAIAMVERHLRCDVAFMNEHGLLHFDAHFRNILTDGQRLYLADFGLATSSRFDLSEAESRFVATNMSHDACYSVTQWVNWLATALVGADDRDGLIRRSAQPSRTDGIVNAPAIAIIKRYAPTALVMNDFYWKLHGESRTTPYPVDEIERACQSWRNAGPEPSRRG